MSAYPSWALLCGILGCLGAVILLAWHTAQEQRAGRFDSLVAVVARSQSLVLFRAIAMPAGPVSASWRSRWSA